MPIEIHVNGDPCSVTDPCSLTELLSLLAIEGRLAIDVNGEIIPRSMHNTYRLKHGDRVEIVHAIGGGGPDR